MKLSKYLVLSAVIFSAQGAIAQDNVGSCGWGSKLFENDKGVAPQVLASITNGFLGNQTFGISSATSGCTRNGVVRSNWKTVLFIDVNREALAADISRGNGENLLALADILGVKETDKDIFFSLAKNDLAKNFANPEATTKDLVESMRAALNSNEVLAQYAAAV